MQLPLRAKLLSGIVAVVLLMGTVSTLAGLSFISRTVINEAMARVELDVKAAWSAFEDEKTRLQVLVSIASQIDSFREAVRAGRGGPDTARELEGLRGIHHLDFLSLTDARGVVVARSGSPHAAGDSIAGNPLVSRALRGEAASGTLLLSAVELAREGEGLVERAHIPLIPTDRAVPTQRRAEDRGMVIAAAIPILDARGRVQGVIYGGLLLNRKFSLVDQIRDAVFGDQTFMGRPIGTVTLFLDDVRIATNVMLDEGTRALGTRVSREVYATVLVRGERFADRAFVVNDWYFSAYDPIRDPAGRIIGIVYVGLLEKKYLGYKSSLVLEYLGIISVTLLLSGGVALYLSNGIRRPILQLVRATRELSAGQLGCRVAVPGASREVSELADAFNSMAETLQKDRAELEQASIAIRAAYTEVAERNKAYLEMLGFVTHELKSPLASIVFAVGSLRDGILGPLNPEQQALLKAAANSADYLEGTIANYLNLSRVEEGELRLRLTKVAYRHDVVEPAIDRLRELAADHGMRIECRVPEDLSGCCDQSLISAVFQNLISNAIKYGREGGLIRITGERAGPGAGLRFSVWNEGPGFDAAARERLFRKFSRLAGPTQDTKSGTGLGLFVAMSIVKKHGGEMEAESAPGQWACFDFTLPEQPAGDEPAS